MSGRCHICDATHEGDCADVIVPPAIAADFLDVVLCNAPSVSVPWSDPAVMALVDVLVKARDRR